VKEEEEVEEEEVVLVRRTKGQGTEGGGEDGGVEKGEEGLPRMHGRSFSQPPPLSLFFFQKNSFNFLSFLSLNRRASSIETLG